MATRKPFQTLRGRLGGVLRSAALALLLIVPAAVAPKAVHAVAPGMTTGPNGSRTRGGFTYDPSAPLNTVVTPAWDPANPPKQSLTYSVHFTGANHQTIPAVFITPVGAVSAPTVLLMHGLGGSKDQMRLVGSILAGKGYASLMIDAAGHGERPKIDGKGIDALDLTGVHTLFAETIADLGRAVDFLDTRPEVDPKRIGYLGISMGSILGAVFIADDPRIKCASLWAGGGDFGKLITTTDIPSVKAARNTAAGGTLDPAAIEAVMRDVDPITTVHDIAPRPLLFLNGDHDTTVPVACADEMIAAAGEPKTRVTLPGGHVPDPFGMITRSIAFFDKNLK